MVKKNIKNKESHSKMLNIIEENERNYILNALVQNPKSLEELVRFTGFNETRLLKRSLVYDIELPKEFYFAKRGSTNIIKKTNNYNTKEIKKIILDALDKNPKDLSELSMLVDITNTRLLRLCKINNIKLPKEFYDERIPLQYKALVKERREKLPILINEGKSLKEIGDYFSVGHVMAGYLVKGYGYHNLYETKKSELKQLRTKTILETIEERTNYVSMLKQYEEQLAKESSFAERKTWEYLQLRPKRGTRTVTNKQLLKLFRTYEKASLKGEKLSLYDLEKETGITFPTVGRILREVNLDRMYRNIEKNDRISAWEKDAILFSVYLNMNSADISYFLHLPKSVVHNQWKKLGKIPNNSQIKRFSGYKILNYSLASQIYESNDLGFDIKETSYLLDIKENIISYALDNRKTISKTIIETLNTLYPEEDIKIPYHWK